LQIGPKKGFIYDAFINKIIVIVIVIRNVNVDLFLADNTISVSSVCCW